MDYRDISDKQYDLQHFVSSVCGPLNDRDNREYPAIRHTNLSLNKSFGDSVHHLQLWNHLSKTIPGSVIAKYPSKNWRSTLFHKNANITLEDAQLLEKFDVSYCSDITIDYIRNAASPECRQHWQAKLNWQVLSRRMSVTDIFENMDLPWNFQYVSENPNITFANVLENLDKNWDWDKLSANKSITMIDYVKWPNHPWNIELLLKKCNLNPETVEF